MADARRGLGAMRRRGALALAAVTALGVAPCAAAASVSRPGLARARVSSAAPTPRSPFVAELGRGKLLIASRTLRDPHFFHSVILLLDYDASGAIGVIINRPTELALAKVLPNVDELRGRDDRVWAGGPVQPDRLLVLIRASSPPRESGPVVDDVYVSSSMATLRAVARPDARVAGFHAFAGYAGWSAGQLDAEVARGDWRVAAGDAAIVFDEAPDEIWPQLIRENSGRWVRAPRRAPTVTACARVAVDPPRCP